eukprot:1850764-Amphidinium_carterae.1
MKYRWVDTMRPGGYKSRLTCQDLRVHNSHPEERIHCPTPSPITNAAMEFVATWFEFDMIALDIVSAFIHAKENNEQIYMQAPPEWKELKGSGAAEVLKLQQVLYGRRSAPAAFRDHLEMVLATSPWHELKRGTLEPCVFTCEQTGLRVSHHVDDLRACGPTKALHDFINHITKYLLTKSGPKLTNGTSHSYLGRRRIRIPDGWVIQPDSKHLTQVFEQLGMKDNNNDKEKGQLRKSVSTPGVVRPWCEAEDQPLSMEDATKYRSCVGSLIYLSSDVECLAYAVKELARHLTTPRQRHMFDLHRVA